MKIILGCGKHKAKVAAPAWQLYTGSSFQLALGWARSVVHLRSIYILSAKYGLIHSTDVIAPYNAQMGTLSQIITMQEIAQQVIALGLDRERPLLANTGKPYRKILVQVLPQCECLSDHWNLPNQGMGFQRSWFKNHHRQLPKELHAIYV